MEKEAGWDKQLEEKDKKVVAGAYHSKENSSGERKGKHWMEKAAGGKRAWHDDRFFRCKTWIYAYKPYFGSTERTIFCICKRKDRRDELVYAGWQIRQLNGERSRMG